MNKKKIGLLGLALLLAVVLFAGIYAVWGPKGTPGTKTITVQVVVDREVKSSHTIETEAEFLGDALKEANLVEGEEGEFGLFVKVVDKIAADESRQQWWCFTKDGEMLNTGVDATPIADQDKFEITLKAGGL